MSPRVREHQHQHPWKPWPRPPARRRTGEIDRAKTAFFNNVSHEFRTPLTLLLGPLEDELRENPSARERLEVAHRNGLRLLKLVNTLLDFSRIEAGRVQATYEPTDLPVFTADMASIFRSAIEKAGLRLVVDCPPLGEPVYVDRGMWEKIVLNLLSNAFKFTFEGGSESRYACSRRRLNSLAATELQPLLEEVLNSTIALQGADFDIIQLYNPRTQALEIVAQRGFRQDFLDHFSCVDESGSGCGRALKRAERVIIEDAMADPDFAPLRAIAASAGFRAVQSTPLFSRNGEPLGMVSTHFRQPHRPSERELRLTDLYARQAAGLIERQHAEDALRASEERFRRYFELGLIGMAMTSSTKGILEINDELCRLLGYERSKLLQKTWAEITHPDDLDADVAQYNRVLAGEIEGYSLDKRWIRKDGRVINSIMAAKCLRRTDGSVDYFVGLVLDTTERKSAEEKLAESERRFRLLAESIPHHVWSLRPDGSVGYWNHRLIDYTGLTEEELRSGGWAALHPDDVERVKAAWEKAWAHGTNYEMEQRVRGRDGRYRRFVCRGVAVKDAQGRPIEWFGTDTDVEERRQAEEALHKAQVELVHATRVTTTGELAASIAHEINKNCMEIQESAAESPLLSIVDDDASKAGAVDFLRKPVSEQALISAIQPVLRRQDENEHRTL